MADPPQLFRSCWICFIEITKKKEAAACRELLDGPNPNDKMTVVWIDSGDPHFFYGEIQFLTNKKTRENEKMQLSGGLHANDTIPWSWFAVAFFLDDFLIPQCLWIVFTHVQPLLIFVFSRQYSILFWCCERKSAAHKNEGARHRDFVCRFTDWLVTPSHCL